MRAISYKMSIAQKRAEGDALTDRPESASLDAELKPDLKADEPACDVRCEASDTHPDHSAELSRIRRISGQLSGVERMINEGRYCPDILMQTRAISAALRGLEASLLERHIKHCVQGAFASQDEAERELKVTELIEIFKKRLER